MKIVAINGSPRKNYNTAQMLNSAIEGAKEAGADVELYHLYDYSYTGCKSCFACKRKSDRYPLETCVIHDELQPILQACARADAIIIGSPVYFGDNPGHLVEFYERLLYPWSPYDEGTHSVCQRRIDYAVIYTLNQPDQRYIDGTADLMQRNMRLLNRMHGKGYFISAVNTKQFDDYSKYRASRINAEAKQKQHDEQFPLDLAAAKDIGRRLAVGLSTPVA